MPKENTTRFGRVALAVLALLVSAAAAAADDTERFRALYEKEWAFNEWKKYDPFKGETPA
mgnify:CR=1 FL=1